LLSAGHSENVQNSTTDFQRLFSITAVSCNQRNADYEQLVIIKEAFKNEKTPTDPGSRR